jgi:hypothetical protein
MLVFIPPLPSPIQWRSRLSAPLLTAPILQSSDCKLVLQIPRACEALTVGAERARDVWGWCGYMDVL